MKVVIKIGTSTLTHKTGKINIKNTEKLCKIISDIKNQGNEIIIVSSGAIAMGVGKLSLNSKPTDIPTKQACASIGQCELMYFYDKMFSEYNHTISQILITRDDFSHEDRHQNFTNTLNRLLQLGVMPIINENDTISTNEIKVGDNDTLSAHVAKSISADLLIILSDIDGLYTADPRKDKNAKLIELVEEINDETLSFGDGAGSQLGTGGMKTKLEAAKICTQSGSDMIIINGQNPDLLYDCFSDKQVGTKFKAKKL